jgi:hypothetical protein
VIGCAKDVYRYYGPEKKWKKRFFQAKANKKNLVTLSVIERAKRSSDTKFTPEGVRSTYSLDVEPADHSTVSKSLKFLSKIDFLTYSKEDTSLGKPGKQKNDTSMNMIPGPTSAYSLSKSQTEIRAFVCRPEIRWRICSYLYESDIMLEFLKFHYYTMLIRQKYYSTNSVEKIIRSKGSIKLEADITKIKEEYKESKTFLANKSDSDIMRVATKLAKKHLQEPTWQTDPLYTDFFIRGFICFRVIEQSNL